jgi:putative hydrolase of the HAD superfamily
MFLKQRAVIFDRDNTIAQYHLAAMRARSARYAAIAPTLPSNAVVSHWLAWPGPWPRTDQEEVDFWHIFWNTLAAQYTLSTNTARALQEACADYHGDFTAFDDAVDCLQALRIENLHLAVLTNFPLPSVGLTLQHAGINPRWFTALLSSGMLGVSKPDPRAYRAAADALNLPPSACVFVDDLLENVAGACAVGMRGIWLDRQGPDLDTPFERITSLRGLVDLIGGYSAGEQIDLANISHPVADIACALPNLQHIQERINA